MNLTSIPFIEELSSLIDDFYALISLDYLEEDSNERIESYKLTYKNTDREEASVFVELDLQREKISFGPFGSSALTTKKFSSTETLQTSLI